MDLLTGGEVDWARMPEEFEVFHYPGLEISQPSDPDAWFERLGERLPHERPRSRRTAATFAPPTNWMTREDVAVNPFRLIGAAAWHLNGPGRRLALMTTGDYPAMRFADPLLRAVLASQWGDCALPPGRSAFGMHPMIVPHYLTGAWYPVGGSTAVTEAMVRRIEAVGGSCRVNHEVTSILRDGTGRAYGVAAHAPRGRGGRDLRDPRPDRDLRRGPDDHAGTVPAARPTRMLAGRHGCAHGRGVRRRGRPRPGGRAEDHGRSREHASLC